MNYNKHEKIKKKKNSSAWVVGHCPNCDENGKTRLGLDEDLLLYSSIIIPFNCAHCMTKFYIKVLLDGINIGDAYVLTENLTREELTLLIAKKKWEYIFERPNGKYGGMGVF